jgi:hypothetical protein
MTTQNYLIVENNVVTNLVVWDGNTQTWTPPANATMLVTATTPAMVWEATVVDGVITAWNLVKEMGAGNIGFTWNTTTQVLTTNDPKPTPTGTQTA